MNELRTAFPPGSVIEHLRTLASDAASVRGAIAFWTVDAAYIGAEFTRCLAASESFLCVDIHPPTSIDHLATLVTAGVQVRLHLYDLAGSTEDAGIKGLPRHLMHAKMLLFERRDDAVLWIGSHNATKRSWEGVNLEASVELPLARVSDAYASARRALDHIHNRCDAMRMDLLPYYHWLQENEGTVDVIAIEDGSGDALDGITLSIFGTSTNDYSAQLKKLKEVTLAVTDAQTGAEALYVARIAQTGQMKAANRTVGATEFDERRYAFRMGATAPALQPRGRIPADVYARAHYFVTLQVEKRLSDQVVLAGISDDSAKWIDEDDDAVGQTPDRPLRTYSGRRGDRAPRRRRAVPADEWLSRRTKAAVREERFAGGLLTKRLLIRSPPENGGQSSFEL